MVRMGTQDIIFLSQKTQGIWSPYVQNLWPLTCLFAGAFLVTWICNNSNVIFIASLSGPFHLEKIFIISVYGQITPQFCDQSYIISYVSWFWCSSVSVISYFYLGICALSRQKKKKKNLCVFICSENVCGGGCLMGNQCGEWFQGRCVGRKLQKIGLKLWSYFSAGVNEQGCFESQNKWWMTKGWENGRKMETITV